MVIGVIVGGYILTPQVGDVDSLCQDQTEQEDSNQEIISEQTAEAVTAGAQASVERTSYLIEEILGADQVEDVSVDIDEFLPSPSKVFRIVFEHIISPNSP